MTETSKTGDIIDIIKTRRSVRKFASQPVPDEIITALLDAALSAPSASNRQSWHFTAVTNRAVIKAMADSVREEIKILKKETENEDALAAFDAYAGYFTFFENAPLVIAACFIPRPNYINALTGRSLRPEDNLEQTTAIGAAIQNLLLAAHSLGYGACWMSGPLIAEKRISELLKLDGLRLAAIIPVGAAVETPRPPKRKDADKLTARIV